MEWAKYLAVVLTAMAPWGEELIAIPLGIGLGLSTPVVAAIALFFNYIPALTISILFKFGQNSPRLFRWLGKLRRERIKRILYRPLWYKPAQINEVKPQQLYHVLSLVAGVGFEEDERREG